MSDFHQKMNISEFERLKPRITHQKIERALDKYKKMVKEYPIMEDEDAIKVEMANEFVVKLEDIKKSFKKGE